MRDFGLVMAECAEARGHGRVGGLEGVSRRRAVLPRRGTRRARSATPACPRQEDLEPASLDDASAARRQIDDHQHARQSPFRATRWSRPRGGKPAPGHVALHARPVPWEVNAGTSPPSTRSASRRSSSRSTGAPWTSTSQRLHQAALHDMKNHAHPHVVERRCDPRARNAPDASDLVHHQSSDVATERLPGLHAGDFGSLAICHVSSSSETSIRVMGRPRKGERFAASSSFGLATGAACGAGTDRTTGPSARACRTKASTTPRAPARERPSARDGYSAFTRTRAATLGIDAHVSDGRGYVIDVVVGALHAEPVIEAPLEVRSNLAVLVVRETARNARAHVLGEALADRDLGLGAPRLGSYALPKRKSSMMGIAFLSARSAPLTVASASSAALAPSEPAWS